MSCIETTRARNNKGYGNHRQVWIAEHGPTPSGMVVMHSCDNPPCINLDHLSLGTYSENTLDAVQKGRLKDRPGPAGTKNTKAKLDDYAVRWIRSLYGPHTQQQLADMFGVTQSVISKIVRRKTWTTVR